MLVSTIHSLVRVVLDVFSTSRSDRVKLQAEVLVLRQQPTVLERLVKRVRWEPADRGDLYERRPRSGVIKAKSTRSNPFEA